MEMEWNGMKQKRKKKLSFVFIKRPNYIDLEKGFHIVRHISVKCIQSKIVWPIT